MVVEKLSPTSFIVYDGDTTRYLVQQNGALCYRTTPRRIQVHLRETPKKILAAIAAAR